MKRTVLILVLALLTACAPQSAESSSSTEISNDMNVAASAPASTVQYTSSLGFSAAYDPTLFAIDEPDDESVKREQLAIKSLEEINGFPVCFRVTFLDASNVEEGVDSLYRQMNLNHASEEVTFGSDHYAATRLTYDNHHTDSYAVGECYVTEQNGAVFNVEISSYYHPSDDLLAGVYAILDSLTF